METVSAPLAFLLGQSIFLLSGDWYEQFIYIVIGTQ